MFAAMSSDPPTPDHPPTAPRSTIVHGNDELGVSAFATGVALRLHGRFRWMDCARVAPIEDLPVHWIFARGSALPEPGKIDPAALKVNSMSPTTLHKLVVPGEPDEEIRLASFLALPELFQRLGARDFDADGAAAILLANVDSPRLPGGMARIEDRELHDLLRRAGISLFATAGAFPPARLLEPFDRVYRLEVPPEVSWSNGVVVLEQGDDPGWQSRPISVRDAWREMELDPSLLPPF